MKSQQSSQQQINENLYQIPGCTICLNQLTQDLSSLNCGHVFHLGCIAQHFQYRGTCPNCQKRATQKQIRMVIYPVTKNNQASMLMRRLISQLNTTQKQQVQKLFKQYQTSVQKNQKYQSQIVEYEKQQKKIKSQLNQTKTIINKNKIQIQSFRKQILQLRKVLDHRKGQIQFLKNQNLQLSAKILNYQQQQMQIERIKKYKRLMQSNGQSLINHKNQLQAKNTSPQDMAKAFHEIALMKNLQIVKQKNKVKDITQKIIQKQQEIKKITWQLEKSKSQNKQLIEKKNIDKKRIQQLKSKYRNVVQKYRAIKPTQQQNDVGQDSALSKPLMPQIIFNNINNSNLNINIKNSSTNGQTNLLDFAKGRQQNNSRLPNNTNLVPKNSNKMQEQTMKIQRTSQMKLSMMKIQTQNQLDQGSQKNKPNVNSINTMYNNNKPQMFNFGSFGGIGKKKLQDKDKQKKTTIKGLFD